MAGDAGALVSIGLLRSIPFADMEECILKQWSTGGHLSLLYICTSHCILFAYAELEEQLARWLMETLH